MKVEVADVAAKISRSAQAYLSIHVGSVKVDLTAVLVDDAAGLDHTLFKDSVGGGVGDHQGSEPLLMFARLGAQVLQIDIALFIAADWDYIEASKHRAGWVGAMG